MFLRKGVFVFVVVIGIVAWASGAFSGTLSPDYLYLYEDGRKVTDNSVVVEPKTNYHNVCAQGVCRVLQEMTKRKVTFYKTGETDLLPRVCARGDDACFSRRKEDMEYSSYLLGNIENSEYSISIFIPAPIYEKAYGDNKITEGIAATGAGGVIGEKRCFKVDIKKGAMDKIQCP